MDKWRTPEAAEYRKLYGTKEWRRLREVVLLRDFFRCQRCGVSVKRGRSDPKSAVIHHIDAHRGDLAKFYNVENLQVVCWHCHSGVIHSEEKLGYSKEIGEDGWPLDPKHPASK